MDNFAKWQRCTLVALAAVTLTQAHGADVNGRIRGTVTDPTGAQIPNSSIVAVNEATGVKFTTVSSANGSYLFPQLPIGTYDITASAAGFKGFKATGITIAIDQEYVEAVTLTVGDTAETVQVQADAVQVNTTDMQLNNIVDSKLLVELPLIGRNFSGLELIEPGVQAPSDRFGTLSVSGAQSQQSEFLVNGADTNDIALNTLAIAPNLDAIAQFNLIEGPLNAEYDRNSGGIVSATLLSGTNKIHGDAFEFYRDTFLNTNNFFQKSVTGQPTPVSPYHQNIFGGTIGAPIVKDKAFIFFGYQGTRQRVPEGSGSDNVYSAANLTGNFSDDLTGTGPAGSITAGLPASSTFQANPIPASITSLSAANPACIPNGTNTWAACLTALNGIIPTAAFNPIAASLVKQYVPAANSGTYGYLFNETDRTTTDQYLGRLDYSLNPRNQFTFVGIYQSSATTETLPFTGATLPGFGDQNQSHIQQYTFDYVRQLSSSAVNDFAVHWTRFNFAAVEPQATVSPNSLGFNITPQNAAAASVPTLGIANFFTLGFSTNGPQPRIDQVYQLDDNFSKTVGHHQLKFGYDGRRFNVSNPFSAENSGSYSFNNTSSTYGTGDPSLDFLLGIPGSYAQGSGASIQADAFLNYFYAQDTWKATSTLTVDYGLGYSIDTPLREHQYQGEGVACFIAGQQSKIFANSPLGLDYPGDPGCTDSSQAYTRHSEFGPRIGFAYAPDLGFLSGQPGRFSIRGGFGIYYDRSEEETALQTLETPPFGTTSTGANDFGGVPQFANPFADINNGRTTGVTATGAPAPGTATETNRFPYAFPVAGQTPAYDLPIYNISTYGPGFRAPYAENFQLSMEREFPSKIIARVSYVGSLARHNQITYEADYETAAGHTACAASATCISDRNFQSLVFPGNVIGNNPNIIEAGQVGSEGSSSYNGLEASITKAPTHGLYFQLSYTYSHALDNGSSFENSGFGGTTRGYNQYNTALNYGDSSFDARQRLVFSPVYTVPILKGHSAFSPVNLLLSGLQVSAIATVATGFPFDVSYGGGTSRSLYCSDELSFYACPDVPVQVAPISRLGNIRTRLAGTGYTSYINPNSFVAEPIGTFGNTHRDPYHGPGINNTNLILAKNFNVSADGVRKLQLRLESDNVFNHTQFSNPGTTVGSFSSTGGLNPTGSFGQITSAAAARQSQLAAKFYF